MAETVIRVENISKKYRIGLKEEIQDSLTGKFFSMLSAPFYNFNKLKKLTKFDKDDNRQDVIWALKNLSFNVEQGEVLGIIGANGAGKSTLLKILANITEPTNGRVEIHGRIASLLEVGTGFHPDLTGRENIYLNGTILGMTKNDIDSKFDEILEFSGVEKFVDTPVKRYSSGMKVRLAFSVAAHLDPDILLVDEVLAVGDEKFRKKCLQKMDTLSLTEGKTVIFVSHNLNVVKSLCQKCLLLKDCMIESMGPTGNIINMYLDNFKKPGTIKSSSKGDKDNYSVTAFKTKDDSISFNVTLKDLELLNQKNNVYVELICLTNDKYILSQNLGNLVGGLTHYSLKINHKNISMATYKIRIRIARSIGNTFYQFDANNSITIGELPAKNKHFIQTEVFRKI